MNYITMLKWRCMPLALSRLLSVFLPTPAQSGWKIGSESTLHICMAPYPHHSASAHFDTVDTLCWHIVFDTLCWHMRHVRDMFVTCSWHVRHMFVTCLWHVRDTFVTCSCWPGVDEKVLPFEAFPVATGLQWQPDGTRASAVEREAKNLQSQLPRFSQFWICS